MRRKHGFVQLENTTHKMSAQKQGIKLLLEGKKAIVKIPFMNFDTKSWKLFGLKTGVKYVW